MPDIDVGVRRGLPGLAYPERYLQELAAELADRFDGTFSAKTVVHARAAMTRRGRYVARADTAAASASTAITAAIAA
jgi:hypothetical protein